MIAAELHTTPSWYDNILLPRAVDTRVLKAANLACAAWPSSSSTLPAECRTERSFYAVDLQEIKNRLDSIATEATSATLASDSAVTKAA